MRRPLSLAMVVPWAALAALAGCGPDFDPPSEVQKLRLLAVKAEPPEIGAGGDVADRAAISALVADPAQYINTTRSAMILHLACTPDPREPGGDDCTAIESLRDPEALSALLAEAAAGSDGAGTGVVGGVSLAGIESCDGRGPCVPATIGAGTAASTSLPAPVYVVPPELDLAGLPEGTPARISGVQVSVLSILIAASPDELLDGGVGGSGSGALDSFLSERENVISVKRIQIRGPEARDPPNVNPSVPGILADGAPLPADGSMAVAPGAETRLSPRPPVIPVDALGQPLPEEIYQRYTRLDQYGQPVGTLSEEWLYSWFGTSGSFTYDRTRADEVCTWTAPDGSQDEPLPPEGRAYLFLVVRDARGGIDWIVREVRVGS